MFNVVTGDGKFTFLGVEGSLKKGKSQKTEACIKAENESVHAEKERDGHPSNGFTFKFTLIIQK